MEERPTVISYQFVSLFEDGGCLYYVITIVLEVLR